MSITVMLLWAAAYCFWPGSATWNDAVGSLYYSIVTFTTLGYGDIAQRAPAIRLFSAAEAIIGAVSFGLMVAGFANKSRY
ncbi:potassium channel family protein [Sorangium sp. So ce388]|uniref:potassium channel family protein n=1 Tax=Sorangium sp. So ce388 TaxID=3133309 RepID=UPI003F5BD399